MNDRGPRPSSSPFGMGRQGYVILAIIIVGTAVFAATRKDWATMVICALVLPLILVALIHLVTRLGRDRTRVRESRWEPRDDGDFLTFLARTNPLMFLLAGALSRGVDDDRYQKLLRSGPYGMGQLGYLIALAVILAPLILALIITAVTGHLPAHSTP